MSKYIYLFPVFMLLASCASTNNEETSHKELYQYAQASCMYWYFKNNGYKTDDIRAITGGIVEKSDSSIEKYQNISVFIRDYSPSLDSKNKIDPDLNKCFHLEESSELRKIISM